jgi:hypothetical protein
VPCSWLHAALYLMCAACTEVQQYGSTLQACGVASGLRCRGVASSAFR